MSEQITDTNETEEQANAKADAKAILVMFCAAIAMAVHFISGFTFDF